jgi:hypothetical protein
MAGPASSAESIRAEIPYLRSNLDKLFVEYTARILDDSKIERHTVAVRNGRTAAEPPSLGRAGFEIVSSPSRVVRERRAELMAERTPLHTPQVQLDYWNESIPLIRKLSGAAEVVPVHASTVRFSPNAEKKKFMTPAGWAHLDYGGDEIEVQLRETLELNGRPVRPYSHYVLYQTWRVLTDPPQDFPLALCDGRTVKGPDIVPIDYHMKTEARDVTYRSHGSRYSERHQWWYFPEMTIDEILVFKGFDSAALNTMKTLHTSFEDPTAENPVPRASIEARFFALYD